jgi:ketosteroid isomerase-like protein
MTSEAVAVVRAFFELLAAGDFARMTESLDPDVVWFGTRGGLDEGQVLRGTDAWLEYMHEIQDPWKRFDVEVERIIDGGDTVVVFIHETAEARHGGLEVQNDTAMIIKVRQHRIFETTGYLDRDEALRAAGLNAQSSRMGEP